MIKKSCHFVCKSYSGYVNLLEKYGSSILLLAIRVFIGLIFLRSGLAKLSNIQNAIYLFQYEYNVPFLNPVFAAYAAMTFEICCSALLFAGLLTRVAVLPLIAISIIIQTVVEQNIQHYYWMFLLVVLAVYGPGKISVDNFTKDLCSKNKK